ncbi:hypothetical protein [Niallia sp. BSM11]|uniref:hypothetical protein n=1 Tax=Niallia sp. BSM11 TaxID=3391576 RepID=UPI00398493E7
MKLIGTFDMNEIALLIFVGVTYAIMVILPKVLSTELTILSIVWGFTIGVVFDFTIGGGRLDYYRVNDINHYELFDFVYYMLFVPFGYCYNYFYEVLRIRGLFSILYIVVWAGIGIGAQFVFSLLHIITLQNGYKLVHSLPVFLIIQTVTAFIYAYIKKEEQKSKSKENE